MATHNVMIQGHLENRQLAAAELVEARTGLSVFAFDKLRLRLP